MTSEMIVVLVLIVIAVGFVIWIRMNSHDYEDGVQAVDNADESKNKGR
jgi:1,4-dihydroxy-2-naphthoate octaprenyltransferase